MSKQETCRKCTRQEEKNNIFSKIKKCIHAGKQRCNKKEIFGEQIRTFESVNM